MILKKVVVLGSAMANELFDGEDAVGKYININKVPYKVIGVLNPISTMYNSYEDLNVYIPSSSMNNISNSNSINTLYVNAKSKDDLNLAQMDLEKFLVKELGGTDSYMIESSKNLETMKSMDKILNLLVGSIASIYLFVSGIGIMNMMLVSVTEGTKEIGIRKALGAKRKAILTQFLIEALVISLIGAILGCVIGIMGSNGVLSVMGAKPYIGWNVIILSMLFAITVGVVFGIIPANKASKLSPIDALRTE